MGQIHSDEVGQFYIGANTKSQSFGFMRAEANVPGMRSAGSQTWADVLNTHYWFDPAKDVCATIMTQTLPFVEARFMAACEQFERAVYAAR